MKKNIFKQIGLSDSHKGRLGRIKVQDFGMGPDAAEAVEVHKEPTPPSALGPPPRQVLEVVVIQLALQLRHLHADHVLGTDNFFYYWSY